MECKGPEDCLGHEYCADGLCRDKQHGCKANSECIFGYYCDIGGKDICLKQVCRDHDDCPVGQGCDYIELGWRVRDNAKTFCFSWRRYSCSDKDPCPEGWVCDRGSGMCVEDLCDEDRPCQDDRYICENNICVPRSCEDRADPLGYCMGQKGWYGRCLGGLCTVLDCDFYPDPDLMCQETEGENWRCVEKRCIDFGSGSGGDPKKYCSEILGVDEAYWDFEKQSCEVPDCDTVADPDVLCAQLKNPSYTCRDGECRHGREGEECERRVNCIPGLRCAGGLCIEKECIRWQDCNDPEKWCNHGVCEPLRKECKDQSDCRDDYHCDAGGQCVPNDCEDHYDCGIGECCNAIGECVLCETKTCWEDYHCRKGWRCNPKTNKCERMECTIDVECEEGYYCNLDTGRCERILTPKTCWDDDECPEGQVCKGVREATWEAEGWPFSEFRRKEKGICVGKGTRIVVIEGIDDLETCDFCRSMWSMTFVEGRAVVYPPYHKGCRCRERSED
jgi:hypothetical protein